MNDGNVYHEDVSANERASYLVAIRTDNGVREWVADDLMGALEQHGDAFWDNSRPGKYDEGEFPLEAKIVRLVESNV